MAHMHATPHISELPPEIAQQKIQRVRQVLAAAHYVAIATVNDDGSPHVSPVFMARDAEGTIFWGSHPQAGHSRNIARNPEVFMVIYDSQSGGGVFFAGPAVMLTQRADVETAVAVLNKASQVFRDSTFGDPQYFMNNNSPQRIYKVMPHSAWIPYGTKDAAGRYIRDERYEVPISSLL